jgi:hypothetical protein
VLETACCDLTQAKEIYLVWKIERKAGKLFTLTIDYSSTWYSIYITKPKERYLVGKLKGKQATYVG